MIGVLTYLSIKLFSRDLSLDLGRLSPTEIVEKAVNLLIDELAIEVVRKSVPPFRRDMVSLGFIRSEKPTSSLDITESRRKLIISALEQALNYSKNA